MRLNDLIPKPVQPFTPRAASRDAANDAARQAVIVCLIEKALLDIERERTGLMDRYARSQRHANGLLAAIEASDDTGLGSPLDETENAMIYCEKRVRKLEQATVLYKELLQVARKVHGMEN